MVIYVGIIKQINKSIQNIENIFPIPELFIVFSQNFKEYAIISAKSNCLSTLVQCICVVREQKVQNEKKWNFER